MSVCSLPYSITNFQYKKRGFVHVYHVITCLQAPTIAAAAYLRMAGRPPVLPSGNLSYAENFLYMLDSMYVSVYRPYSFWLDT